MPSYFYKNIKSPQWFLTLHQQHPKIAKHLSLLLAGGTITAQSLVAGLPLFACGSVKLIDGRLGLNSRLGHQADQSIIDIANHWIGINNQLTDILLPNKDWRIDLPHDLAANKKYLLICNHQSWIDTSIIQYISENKLPLTRFFAKHELLYIPIVGQAFYLLDFPMMKRHSKEQIAKNPSLANRDLDEAWRACQLLTDKPFVLLNYLEGTRFTPKKHQKQQSPYRHLLKPKAGGLALAISSLGDKIDGILDMTIVYPDGMPNYPNLWLGNINRLGVRIEKAVMDDDLFCQLKDGCYHKKADNDHQQKAYQAIKDEFHHWLDKRWQHKDKVIDEILADFQGGF